MPCSLNRILLPSYLRIQGTNITLQGCCSNYFSPFSLYSSFNWSNLREGPRIFVSNPTFHT